MDPGNSATDLEGGARFGYDLLVLLLSIAECMVVEMWLAGPSMRSIVGGLQPRLTGASLDVAIGILDATVLSSRDKPPRGASDARTARTIKLLASACAILVVGANAALVLRTVEQLHRDAPLAAVAVAVSGAFELGLLCM